MDEDIKNLLLMFLSITLVSIGGYLSSLLINSITV